MSDVWKRWEGQLADGKFPLHHFLADTNHSAVFLTQISEPEPRQAAIKFISADYPGASQQLALWDQIAQLSHPNLLRLFHSGRCRIEDMNLLYVVTECAEENLAQFLPQRALSPTEVSEMLKPLVDVLAYLHSKSFVHTHVKPSNILAIGDQLKLSSDTISLAGQPRDAQREPDVYDAPESAGSPGEPAAPASDVWSVGVTVVEALTQSAPALPFDNSAEPPVPGTLPQPFLDVARHCLLREPKLRWSASQIADRLSGVALPAVVPRASAAAAGSASASPTASAAAPAVSNSPLPPTPAPIAPLSVPLSQEPAVPLSRLPGAPSTVQYKPKPRAASPANRSPQSKSQAAGPSHRSSEAGNPLSRFLIPGLLGAFVLIVLLLSLPRFFRFRSEPMAASSKAPVSNSTPAASTPSRNVPPSKPAPAAPVTASRDQEASHAVPVPPVQSPSSAASAKPAISNSGHGEVLDEVLPSAPARSLATIHGTFHVTARVQVDPAGKVSDVTLDYPGPSRYFANLSEQAARRWLFSSPVSDGRSLSSEWLLRFDFSSSGVRAVPTQTKP